MSITSVADKQNLNLTWAECKWPLAFMLCMSALGLKFPLAYLFVPLILINRFRKDRYDFIIMLTIFSGEYGLISKDTFGLHPYFLTLIVAFVGVLIYRKSAIVKKLVIAWILYALGILFFAMKSEEMLSIQSGTMIRYISVIYFIVPLMCFSGLKFDIKVFFRRLMPYCLIMCCWYVLDSIINGWIFLPNIKLPEWATESVFYSPVFMSLGTFPRKYPTGLILLILAIYPIVKYYKLQKWQLIVLILALFSCRTFTVITGLIATYIFCQGSIKRFAKYFAYGVIVVVGLYGVDCYLPYNKESQQSTLRIKSSVDQFLILQNMEDEEDLAELGTGRAAQIIPKMELLYDLNRQWIGFGFLHPEKTTNPKYIIENPFYSDISKSEEVAANVEVTVFQHILFIGYLGLLMVICFYGWIFWTVRKLKYSTYLYSVAFGTAWFGIGGFGGWTDAYTLLLVGFCLSVVLLSDRDRNDQNILHSFNTLKQGIE